MRRGERFFYQVTGGDWNDENSEFVQACAAYGGLGGVVPRDFPDIDLCRDYHIPFWELGQLPALHIERIRFREKVRQQSEIDRAENEKS